MRRAFNLLRDQPWYRRQAFDQGLRKVGFEVVHDRPGKVEKGDAVVIWNRYGGMHDIAVEVERRGGICIVAENGYLGKGGTSPKFDLSGDGGPQPHHYYSVSLGWHNGRGTWPSGGPERFKALEVQLKPWRVDGEHILICPNRSFGVGAQVMSNDWADQYAEGLRKQTKRQVRIRRHPGNDEPQIPLATDLRNAWAVVVWSSSVALHALSEGLPTYIAAPWQVVKGASASGPVETPITPERLPHFERMAWHQWTCEEVESGAPFVALLPAAG